MPFLNGSVTSLRFRVDGPKQDIFSEDHLARLRHFQAGRQRIASADGIEVGWAAGDHVLDTTFELDKNIINDALCFDLRVDTDKLPSDLLKAYVQVELAALAKGNPSGQPSARQKKKAREAAKERLEQEAKDGRFKKRKCIPVMWDRPTNTVLFGTTSFGQVYRLVSLFQQTFGYGLEAVTSGTMVKSPLLADAKPSIFLPGVSTEKYAWIADDTSRDWLGAEFSLWLWYHTEAIDDTIDLGKSDLLTLMIARSITLECPSGRTGLDGFKHEGPSRLPEAKRAIKSGKMPRKIGLTMVRLGDQYELTLHPELFAIAGAKLPKMAEDIVEARARLEERVTQVRELVDTLDLLFARFFALRFSRDWSETVAKMSQWLTKGEKVAEVGGP